MAATTAITRNDRRGGRRVRQHSTAALLSVGIGAALTLLALPRLAGEGTVWAAREGLLSTAPGPDLTPAMAGRLTDMAGPALLAPAFAEAGTIWLRLALEGREGGGTLLPAARQAFAHSLALAPAEPLTWFRLSYAASREGCLEAAARAWRMAVLTGTFDPQMMEYRLGLGFSLWPHMDAAGRAAMGRQLAVFWSWGPGTVSELTERDGARDIVRLALADRPDIVADIERRIALRQGK
ncbi:hypothetical protein [Niveispirillum sp. KHB5.9]|uniref:hypothetical protein n=1 Tax=Niveispirillum sp. KHB5.9 TaxID=3400269 RepID=UPI003A854350